MEPSLVKRKKVSCWLDAQKTSPYSFYQFWLNVSDEEASRYNRLFTLLDKSKNEILEEEHKEAPHLRALQKTLAKNITIRVHSEEDYETAIESSEILFGKGTKESLLKLSDADILNVFEGVPQIDIAANKIEQGIPLIDFLVEHTNIFPSKGEAKKMLVGGGVSINKEKVEDANMLVNKSSLLKDRYILAQKGKKNYYLIRVN